MPEGNRIGPGPLTIGYLASGESADWMLHELGITAMTSELGLSDPATDWFFLANADIDNVLEQNMAWVEYTFDWFRFKPDPLLQIEEVEEIENETQGWIVAENTA